MISFLASMVATVALAVTGTFGYHLKTAEDVENPVRAWKERQALCAAPQSVRAASMCALLEDGQATP